MVTDSTEVEVNDPNCKMIREVVEYGLYKVKVDDSTTVLIYRDGHGVSMIQVK
jgi:hypothetical protein